MRYRFGDCLLDTARFELYRGDRCVETEPQVLRLLTLLIENRDRVVPRGELQHALWGRRIVTDNALSVRIRSARRAVGDSGGRQATIRTVPGAGYRFVADVAISAQPALTVVREPAAYTPPDSAERPASTTARAQPSIAVLPFETIGGDESCRIVSRGIVHDVITRIARSRMMFIIARGTAFQFDGGQHDVGTVGEKLGVRYVVQGAVQVAGRRLKVSVALSNTHTRQELWSWQYDRTLDDFMSVQEEIADMIVGTLESEIEREEVQRSLLMPSSNLDAWSAYHRGLHHMYHFRPAECDRAEHFFRHSIDLEPNVPRPYAGLSFIHFERVFLNMDPNRSRGVRQAFEYALQALSVDPLDPMGHWALSRAYLLRGDLDASRKSLQTAVELNPSYAIAQYSLGWVALHLGENALCLDRIELAERLSPYDPLKFAMLGVRALNLALIGRTEEAVALAVQSTLQPNVHLHVYAFAAVTLALDGQLERARAFYSRTCALSPEYGLENFLTIFPFRQDRDLRRIREAFERLGRRPGDT